MGKLPEAPKAGSLGEQLSRWLAAASKVFVVSGTRGEHRCEVLRVQRMAPKLALSPEEKSLAGDHLLSSGRLSVERHHFGETWRGGAAFRIMEGEVSFHEPTLRRDPLDDGSGGSRAGCGRTTRPQAPKPEPREHDGPSKAHAASPVKVPAPIPAATPSTGQPTHRKLALRILAVDPQEVRIEAGSWFADEARCEAAARQPGAKAFDWSALGLNLPAPPAWILDPAKDELRRRIRSKGRVWFVVLRGGRKTCEGWQLVPDRGSESVASLEHSVNIGRSADRCRFDRSLRLRHEGKVVLLHGPSHGTTCQGVLRSAIAGCGSLALPIRSMTRTHALIGRAGCYFDLRTCLAARARETGRDTPSTWHPYPP